MFGVVGFLTGLRGGALGKGPPEPCDFRSWTGSNLQAKGSGMEHAWGFMGSDKCGHMPPPNMENNYS